MTGLVLSGLGLGSVMYGISEGPSQGWSAAPVPATIAAGAVLLALMVAVELRAANPLVDLRLLGNRMFACATSLYGLASVAYLGALFLAALFFQDALGLGVSFVFIPSQAASMATITKAQTGHASSIFNAGKQLGGAIGVALLSTVLAAAGPTQKHTGHVNVNLAAYHDAFLAAAAVAVLDAAATMTRRTPNATKQQDKEPAVRRQRRLKSTTPGVTKQRTGSRKGRPLRRPLSRQGETSGRECASGRNSERPPSSTEGRPASPGPRRWTEPSGFSRRRTPPPCGGLRRRGTGPAATS